MSTSCMQAIKQQLEAMPLEEFEDLLKGVAVNKGHEGMPQHAELLSQLQHHVKVQPDEPIQSKASDKDCRTFWKSLNQRDKSQRLSSSGNSGGGGCGNLNGNVSSSGNHNSHYNHHKHSSLFASSPGGRSFPAGDQNANPVSSNCDTPSSAYYHQPVHNLIQPGKYHDYNNQNHIHHHSTLAYGNCVSASDADPGGLSRRSHEHDSRNDNTTSTFSSPMKNSSNAADDHQEDEDKPEKYTGTLPPQYILPSVTKLNNNKELPLQFFHTKSHQNSIGASGSHDVNPGSSSPSLCQSRPLSLDSSVPSSSSWELNNRNAPIQLNESYKSVSSVTSGASSYMGRTSHEQVHGTIRAVSPTLPPSSTIITKSPPVEGSHNDKPTRRGGDRKKKSAKHVLREKVINPQDMPGFRGHESVDILLEFLEGNQAKGKDSGKDKEKDKERDKSRSKDKKRDVKLKGNEKQVLSKAASLDENSLEYGSKKAEDIPLSRSIKDVEKKNATNITKSSSAICSGLISVSTKVDDSIEDKHVVNKEGPSTGKAKAASPPIINGSVTLPPKNGGSGASKSTAQPGVSISGKPPLGKTPEKVQAVEPIVSSQPSIAVSPILALKPTKVSSKRSEDDKFGKLDESEGPYVLVQSKKKEKKKKSQQREQEVFVRPHTDQGRRDAARVRRTTAERRKSVGSVPGSENSECSDDDDSVRSLPAGECTPREKIPKPCSSSGGTPQTSYADIARMSRDENGKPPNTPIILIQGGPKTPSSSTKTATPTIVAVASDTNFPALSPPTLEKTANVNTAIWPCRPRNESEPAKEKSAPCPVESNKSQEPHVKETPSSFEPSQTASPTPESTKLEPNAIGYENKAPLPDVQVTMDISSQAKSGEDSSVELSLKKNESEKVAVNDVRENTVPDSDRAPSSMSAKTQTKRTEDKKVKGERKAKDDALNTALSFRGLENGDCVMQPTEAVVFCGGKFDGGQLPVGQTIGFEFGFGVIQALNDNGAEASKFSCKTSNLPVLVSEQSVDPEREKGETSRSQVSVPIEESLCEKPVEIVETPNPHLCPTKHPKADPKDEKTPKETLEHPEAPVTEDVYAELVNPHDVERDYAAPEPETIDKPGPAENNGGGKDPKLVPVTFKNGLTLELDLAQLLRPVPLENASEYIRHSRAYMDARVEKLKAMASTGRLSMHRV